MRIITLSLMLAVTTAACFQYYPVQESTPLPERGTEIRAHLSPPVSLSLGTITVHDISTVEGNVFRTQDDSLAIYARWLMSYNGSKHSTNGTVFSVARSQLRQVETQRLSPVRTGIAAGLFAAGMVAVYELLQSARPAETVGEGGGNPPVSLHLFR